MTDIACKKCGHILIRTTIANMIIDCPNCNFSNAIKANHFGYKITDGRRKPFSISFEMLLALSFVLIIGAIFGITAGLAYLYLTMTWEKLMNIALFIFIGGCVATLIVMGMYLWSKIPKRKKDVHPIDREWLCRGSQR